MTINLIINLSIPYILNEIFIIHLYIVLHNQDFAIFLTKIIQFNIFPKFLNFAHVISKLKVLFNYTEYLL